jgi:hypothetical protein
MDDGCHVIVRLPAGEPKRTLFEKNAKKAPFN